MSYETWTKTSKTYGAYLAASARCAEAFTAGPEITARAWTHPTTGEIRYYLDNAAIPAIVGFDAAARALTGIEENISKRNTRTIEGHIETSKFWIDAASKLHIKRGAVQAGDRYESVIADRIRAARIVKTEPKARQHSGHTAGRTGWSKYSRPSNDGGVGAMLGLRSSARSTECHYCGLDRRTCDCR